MRKSLLSALIGIHVHAGNIDTAKTLEALGIDDNAPALTPTEKRATIADLLKARSGVYHPAVAETEWMKARRPARGSHLPGTFWYYNNWDFNALGTIFEQATGTPIYTEFKRRIAEPLQMQDYNITDFGYVGGSDSLHPAYDFRMTARDLARFGLLFLRQGRWQETQVIPAAWVNESIASHSELGPDSGYGYMWWTGSGAGLFPHVKVQGHSYYAAGYGGHWVIVLPAQDLVVVHRVNTDLRAPMPGLSVTAEQMGWLLRLILAASGADDLGEVAYPPEVREGLDSVVLPHNVAVVPPQDNVPPEVAAFSGTWSGMWNGVGPHVLVVEQLTSNSGIATYAWGIARRWGIHSGGWTRVPALLVNGALQLQLQWPATVTYRTEPDGTLSATYEWPGGKYRANMHRMADTQAH
jgi:CubicO group peptidase (beta-lactamase class C family)